MLHETKLGQYTWRQSEKKKQRSKKIKFSYLVYTGPICIKWELSRKFWKEKRLYFLIHEISKVHWASIMYTISEGFHYLAIFR